MAQESDEMLGFRLKKQKIKDYSRPPKGLKPLYSNLYKREETVKERQRQNRVKLISIVIITMVCVVGIGTIAYFIHSA